MSVKVFVPRESTALSLGADEIAEAISLAAADIGADIELIRNGSRGLLWLEPMIEVETDRGRVAYGPVGVEDVDTLVEAGLFEGGQSHALALGLTDEIPQLKAQTRVSFKRIGLDDPLSLDAYRQRGGFRGLQDALSKSGQEIIDEVKASGLRGRGGAAFPSGIKWQTVHDAQATQKYIVCNADEGDSGTFADRLIMECDPYLLIEGMTIAGLAVGASEGYI
ncbi:MAG: formate dehydrogenase, partial [Gammaproteobacteria bacterium]|nr:formate dehydrogenase [Gammaproteobacteria bacterium]